MNARDSAHRTTVAVTTGLAAAALATTITVGLVVARSENAEAATDSGADSGTDVTTDTGSSGSTQSDQSPQSDSGSSGSSGISPGSGSADATSGGS